MKEINIRTFSTEDLACLMDRRQGCRLLVLASFYAQLNGGDSKHPSNRTSRIRISKQYIEGSSTHVDNIYAMCRSA